MKIACCFYGHVGGIAGRDGHGGWLDPALSLTNYVTNLFFDHQVDFFAHSWSIESENEIKNLINLKNSIFEPQKDFSTLTLADYNLSKINDYIGIIKSQDNPHQYLSKLIQRAHSRWYSTKEVLDLCEAYSISNGALYDAVFLLRFDLHFYQKTILPNINEDTLYTSRRLKDPESTVDDLVLFGSPSVIFSFKEIYENIYNFSARPPCSIKQLVDSKRFTVDDQLIRGLDFDLVRETSENPSQSMLRRFKKRARRMIAQKIN
jgi:hypothetical protein